MAKTAKQIHHYLKSQPWFKEYIYEIHVGGIITDEEKIEDYIQGRGDYYTITGAFDWKKANSGEDVWKQRSEAFFNWYNRGNK